MKYVIARVLVLRRCTLLVFLLETNEGDSSGLLWAWNTRMYEIRLGEPPDRRRSISMPGYSPGVVRKEARRGVKMWLKSEYLQSLQFRDSSQE